MPPTVGLNDLAKGLLTHLTANDAATGGKNIAQSISRCIPLIEQLLAPEEVGALIELVNFLGSGGGQRSSQGAEGQASWGASKGLRGALISNRVYPSHEPSDELDVLLGLLVAYVTRSNDSAREASASLFDEIGVLSRKLLASDEARAFVRQAIGPPSVPLSWRQVRYAYSWISGCERGEAESRLKSKSAPRALIRLLKGCCDTSPAHTDIAPGSGRPASRLHDRLSQTQKVIELGVPLATDLVQHGLHQSDAHPEVAVLRSLKRSNETVGDAQRRIYVSHQLKLDGLFFEYSNVTLSFPEARVVTSALLDILRDKKTDESERTGALALLLQGMTGRDLKFVGRYSATGVHSGAFDAIGADGTFRVPIPSGASFWKPAVHDCNLPQAHLDVLLKLPAFMVEIIGDEAAGATEGRIFPPEEATIHAALAVAKRLRKNVASRFTLDRWRGVLPLSVFRECGDPRVAQIVCGDRLGLSDAPLYYAAYSNSAIQSIYTKALGRWIRGYKPVVVDEHKGSKVGSALGAVSTTEVREWVDLIRPRTSMSLAKSLHSILDAASDLARWSGWMFAAATGYRNNRSIYGVFRREVDLELGLAIITDKVGDQAELARPVVLGKLCVDQIRALLAAYQFVLDRLPVRFSSRVVGLGREEFSRLRSQLQATLRGDGPLFFPLTGRGRTAKDVNAWMMAPLASQRLPQNTFRHVLATHWVACGGAPSDLYAQLGHSLRPQQHFGEESERSVLDFQNNTQPVVDRLLAQFGWEAVQPKGVLDAALYPKAWRSILRRQERFAQEIARISSRNSKSKNEAASNISPVMDKVLEAWVKKHMTASPKPPKLSTETRERLVMTVLGAAAEKGIDVSIGEVEEQFCKRIRSLIQKGQVRSDPLPVFHRLQREPSRVQPAALTAFALLRRCRREALDSLANSKTVDAICGAKNKVGAAYLRFYALCVLNLPEASESDIDAYVDALHRPIHMSQHQCVFLETDAGRCLAIPDWVALPIVDLQRMSDPCPPISTLKQWLKKLLHTCEVFSGQEPPAVQDLVRLGTLSALIERPGLLWPRGEDAPLHKEIDAERAVSLFAAQTGVANPAVIQPQRVLQQRAIPQFGVSSYQNKDAVRETIRKALREREEIGAGIDESNVGLHRATERRRTVQDAQAELAEVFDDLENTPWNYPFTHAASLHLLKTLLSKGANRKTLSYLELRTVRQYYGLVRDHVIPILAEVHVETLGVDDWVDLYERAYVRVTASSRDRAANAFMRFHEVLVEELGVDFIAPQDWPWPCEQEGVGVSYSGVVAQHEHLGMLRLFDSWLHEAESQPDRLSRDGRLVKTAKIVWSLLWNLGLRSASEAMSLRHQDIDVLSADEVVVCLRRSIVAGLKTAAAHRAISASSAMPDGELAELVNWVESERRSASDMLTGQTYVFPDLFIAGESGARRVLDLISAALRHITGRNDLRPHCGRHSFATRQLHSVTGIGLDAGCSNWLMRAAFPIGAFRVLIGHSAIETTLSTYAHVYQFRHAVQTPPDLKDKHIAGLLGRSPASVSRSLGSASTIPSSSRYELFLKQLRVPRSSQPVGNTSLPIEPQREINLISLGRMLHLLWHGYPWELATWRMGLINGQHQPLLRAVLKVGLVLPDLALPFSFGMRLCQKMDIEHPSLRRPVECGAGIPTRRRLSSLNRMLGNLERRYAEFPERRCEDVETIQRSLMRHHFNMDKGAMRFNDWELMQSFVNFLKGAIDGIDHLKVGVATDVEMDEESIEGVKRFLEHRGMQGLAFHNRRTTGSETAQSDNFGVCLLAQRGTRQWEVAGVLLCALQYLLLLESYFRDQFRRSALPNDVVNT